MSATRITGTVEFQNELTGDYRDIRVSFKADSEDAWYTLVDHACELAYNTFTNADNWYATGADTLSEIEADALEGC
jgi:hypothetical protein